jgi:hypothetical protein
MYSDTDTPKGWVAPFRNPRINACSRLPMAFRSVPRLSSPPGAKASTECPYRARDQWPSDRSDNQPTMCRNHPPPHLLSQMTGNSPLRNPVGPRPARYRPPCILLAHSWQFIHSAHLLIASLNVVAVRCLNIPSQEWSVRHRSLPTSPSQRN